MHNYDVTKGRTYMYLEKKPLYPFGYGLSYTHFKMINPSISNTELTKDDTIQLSFDIQNVGASEGSEVVQLYVHERSESKYTAIKVLKAFKRMFLDANEKKRVTFRLPVKELATYNVEKRTFIISPGTYDIMVGNSSDNIFSRKEIIMKE